MQRHVNWHWDKSETFDQESKQLHSAHVVCNAMMLAHYATYWKEGDDRPLFAFKKPEEPTGHEIIAKSLRAQDRPVAIEEKICGVTGCPNKAQYTWSGHPTCYHHALPSLRRKGVD
jgi:hypothetical protein